MICNRCKIERNIEEFDKHSKCKDGIRKTCKHCRNEIRRKRYNKDDAVRKRNKKYITKHRLKSRYGLTVEQYNAMFKDQNGLCKICNNKCPKYGEVLSVDHCHITSEVRGLLCDPCNRLLACARDSIEILKSSIKYLESF